MIRKIVVMMIRILLILLFAYAAQSKLSKFNTFRVQLMGSPLLFPVSEWIAFIIPMIEVFIVFLLLLKETKVLGLYIALSLLSLFTAYLFAILNFSFYIPCSCGGIIQGMSWKNHVIFNLLFISLTITAIILQKGNDTGYSKTPLEISS